MKRNLLYMERKDFLKKACRLGFCSCVLTGLFNSQEVYANENCNDSWKEGFVKHRFSKLIDILDDTLDEETKNHIIENLGRECSKRSGINKYKNNLQGFFNHLKSNWGENASLDNEKKIIRIETAERECFCPMFDSKKVSKSICQCSVGWQSQTYETILGQSVKAECIESVIRGGKKCIFEIKLLE